MYLRAVQYIKPMDLGSTQPHIFSCEDQQLYVVKLSNNPDGIGVLANEWIASRLGNLLGLPIAETNVIEITQDLWDMYPELIRLNMPCGYHIGSLYARDGINLGESINLSGCKNVHHAAGMIVFDHWINNWDRHNSQANLLYLPNKKEILLIDHSDSFFGPYWNIDKFNGNYGNISLFWGPIYEKFVPYIDNFSPFDTFLTIVESLSEDDLRSAIQGLPEEWSIPEKYLDQLVYFLLLRKERVRFTIDELFKHFTI